MLQKEAFDLLKMGKNVFLTGAAGSGKTYLLNKYIKYLKDNNVKVAVTASTGLAATHLYGMTIHSWSGIGIRDTLNDKDLEKILDSRRIKSNYKKTKVLIIDEVSMLHKHQLDMINLIAGKMLSSNKAFGGIQVILCGDFFQLPPVSSGASLEKARFAFEADAWEKGDFHICYLQEQHRQNNNQSNNHDPLLTVLNSIRSGTAGEHTKVPLRTRYKKEPEGSVKATKLYSRNINVDEVNNRELAKLKSEERVFAMQSDGFKALVDGLKRNCLAPEYFKLKIGAEVMFIKNDPEGRFVNGTRCVVINFDKTDGWPIVKTYNNKIITAAPMEWTYEDNGIVRASITQVPLRLAWAITIHKSQGMTLDAAEIDLGNAFEPGMGYVALSRVRSLKGLKLMNLNEMALTVHPEILDYDKVLRDNSAQAVNYLKGLSAEEIAELHKKVLTERFAGSKSKEKKVNNKDKTDTYTKTLVLLKEKLSVDEIASKREMKVRTILGHLEKLKGLKKINSTDIAHLKDMIPSKDFEVITAELKKSTDGKLKPIYDFFNGKFSYTSITLARLFVGLSRS